VWGLVSPAAQGSGPVGRLDEVVDQCGHVVLGTRCRVVELVSTYT
jgi:hypothetical protein